MGTSAPSTALLYRKRGRNARSAERDTSAGREAAPAGPWGGTRPPGKGTSRNDAALRRTQMAFQERREDLLRRPPAEALHRPVVEHVVDPAHLLVQDGVERTSLRQAPTHDSVAVLVRPAFPRVVRLGKVTLDAEGLCPAFRYFPASPSRVLRFFRRPESGGRTSFAPSGRAPNESSSTFFRIIISSTDLQDKM